MNGVAHITQMPYLSGGYSKIANLVNDYIIKQKNDKMNTATYSQPFYQLRNIINECCLEGWDGYDASAIDISTYYNALKFLSSIPCSLPVPEASPEPDGHIAFEWYNKPRYVVSISISPENYLHYAAIIGLKKRSGSEPLLNGIPEDILDIIYQVIEV